MATPPTIRTADGLPEEDGREQDSRNRFDQHQDGARPADASDAAEHPDLGHRRAKDPGDQDRGHRRRQPRCGVSRGSGGRATTPISTAASRSGFTRVASQQATAIILTMAAVLMGVVALPAELISGHPASWLASPVAWVSILIAGILGAAMAKVWMLRGVRRVGGTRAAVLMLVEPVTGVLLAAILLGQAISPVQIVGGVAVLGGALLAQRPASAR